jgi:hypothetical protein
MVMETLVPHWYLRTDDGVVYGPAPREQLVQWHREGRLQPESEVSREFPYVWQRADQVFPEIFQLAGKIGAQPPRPHRGPWLLTLAILGLCCACPIFSIAAWVMATAELREMERGERDPNGRALVILAWRAGVAAAAFWIALALLAFWVASRRAALSM